MSLLSAGDLTVVSEEKEDESSLRLIETADGKMAQIIDTAKISSGRKLHAQVQRNDTKGKPVHSSRSDVYVHHCKVCILKIPSQPASYQLQIDFE